MTPALGENDCYIILSTSKMLQKTEVTNILSTLTFDSLAGTGLVAGRPTTGLGAKWQRLRS